jgi:integrase
VSVTPARDKTKPKGPDGRHPIIAGLFDVAVWYVGDDGQRHRMTRRVAGRAAAKQVEREFLTARDQGERLGKAPTLDQWAALYFKRRRRKVTPRTMEGYRFVLRAYLAPTLGKRPLTAITKSMVDGLETDLLDRGLSAGTVRAAHRVLGLLLQGALADGLVRVNVVRLVDPPKADSPERGIEPDEAKRLLAGLEGTALHAPVALAALTALRRGEILALRWADVDFEAAELHVRAALEQVGQAVEFKEPKSKRSIRVVPLTPAAIALLRRHRAEQDAKRLELGPAWTDQGLVFPRQDATQRFDAGRVWAPHDFSTAFRTAQLNLEARRLGEFVAAGGAVEDFEPKVLGLHETRHLALTSWLKAGIRIEVVSRWAGHSDSTITARVYSHTHEDEQRPAGLDAVDEVI